MTVLETGHYLGDVQRSVSTGGLKVSYTTYRHDNTFEFMHAHANPHFSFVLSGGNLEKRKNKELQRLPGTLTFYHSGEYHQNLYAVNGSAHLNIELGPDFLVQHKIKETGLVAIADEPASKFWFLKLYKEALIQDDVSQLNIHAILLSLLRNCEDRPEIKPGWAQKIDQYLRANLDRTISLRSLSVEVGVHPVTISKHFSKYFSCTLGEHIRKLRTEKALELIKSSSLSLTMIATSCGFTDQSHFIRTFKHYTGFRPKEFRKS